MWKRLRSLFVTQTPVASENELQALRLELAERDKQIMQLKADLERQRREAGQRGEASIQAQLEQLLADAALPVAQLQTQAHLLEAEQRPVQAKDILVVARRLVRVLEDQGLSLEQQVGEQAAFDPNRHEPLNATQALSAGQPVIVRFVGVSFQGKILRKAGVEPQEIST
jgi:molecular chaperone GrpE (heat shock protein)